MKMPRRPFYPPVALPPDIFGLHDLSLLCESEADTKKRIATVEEGVIAAFKAAVRHLGEEEARRLFKRVMRRPKRGQGKVFAPDRDARLLEECDAAVPEGETVAALAKRLHAAAGIELGNTAGAIETQIRKLQLPLKRGDGEWQRAGRRVFFRLRRARNSRRAFSRSSFAAP